MKIEDIFFMSHSNSGGLIPLKNAKNKEFEKLIKDNGLDVNNFYIATDKFYPYCYMNGTVCVAIYGDTQEIFDSLRVKSTIEHMEELHKKCIETKDYDRLFIYIDKPYRFYWYEKLFDDIPDENKYEIFLDIYSGSEYGFNTLDRDFIEEIFKYKKEPTNIPCEDDILTIYRGEASMSTSYKEAFSWTLDKDVARWFANRFNSGKAVVYKANVKKEDILEYLDDRNEAEVLVFPEKLFNVEKIV